MNRLLCAAMAAVALLPHGAVSAADADFPSKPLTILVPYPPGGTTDSLSRMVAQKLSTQLKQPVVVDNKPGASEQIAASFLKRAPADGHTIMLMTMTGMAVNPGLYGARLPYDPLKDFAPIIHAVTIPSVIAVNPSVPVKSVTELTAYAKAHPQAVNYASSGNGTPSHLGMELYKRLEKVEMMHVPYKGGAPALQDLMAGQVNVMMALAPEAMPIVKAGKAKALALTAPKRSPLYPDLPTASEAGLKDFDLVFWYAYLAPAGTPRDVVVKLNHAIDAILHDKDIGSKLAEMGLDVSGGSPEKLADIARREGVRWKKVIDDAGITVD